MISRIITDCLNVISGGSQCITDCVGRTDGNYGTPKGCRVYALCVEGKMYDNVPCPSNLEWNDDKKMCHRPPSPTCPCE